MKDTHELCTTNKKNFYVKDLVKLNLVYCTCKWVYTSDCGCGSRVDNFCHVFFLVRWGRGVK